MRTELEDLQILLTEQAHVKLVTYIVHIHVICMHLYEDFRKRLIQNQDFVCKHILRDEKNINEISLL